MCWQTDIRVMLRYFILFSISCNALVKTREFNRWIITYMFMLCRLVHSISGQIKVNIGVAHQGMEIDIKPVLLWKWGWSHFLIEKKINVQIVLTKNLCSYKDHHSRKYFYLEYIFVENLSFRINCVWKENICFKLHVNGGKIIILTEAIRFCFMVGEKSYFFQWRKSSTKNVY